MAKKRRAEEYENEEIAPAAATAVRNKKVKKDNLSTKNKKQKNDGGAVGSEGKIKRKKVPGDGGRDGKGEEFWELSGKRRVTVSLYGGKHMINIREYYEKDGDFLPGKKGISLTMEQFNSLVSALPHIETVLAEKGETIPRPEYDASEEAATEKAEAEDEGEEHAEDSDEEDEEDEEGISMKRQKKNFEETSDEQ